MATDSRRLSILTTQEIDDLFGLPHFTENDRRFFFDLNPAERDLVDSVYTISVAVHLILQLGLLCQFRQVPRENRSGAANLERVLAASRECDYLCI